MRLRALAVALFVVASGLASGVARANDDTEQAVRLFRAGSTAYAHHDFLEAAHRFEDAYHLAPRGAAIYDAGLAWEQAGDLAHAADDYAIAVGNPDVAPDQRSDATSRLKALEARVGRLLVTGPADARVTVDDGADAAVPLSMHLMPGQHWVRVAYASGAPESRKITLSAGNEEVVRLTEPAAAPAPAPTGPATTLDHTPDAEQGASSDATSMRRTLAWTAAGGAVVSSVFALYFLEEGISALHKDQNSQPAYSDAQAHDAAVTDRTVAQVLTGLAVALGATSFYLFVTSSDSSKPSTSLRIGPANASLRVTF